VPGTPRNSTLSRSSNPVPEPTTRSPTVRETRISRAGLAACPKQPTRCSSNAPRRRPTNTTTTEPFDSLICLAAARCSASSACDAAPTSCRWDLPMDVVPMGDLRSRPW
jgi:hypothetical protein